MRTKKSIGYKMVSHGSWSSPIERQRKKKAKKRSIRQMWGEGGKKTFRRTTVSTVPIKSSQRNVTGKLKMPPKHRCRRRCQGKWIRAALKPAPLRMSPTICSELKVGRHSACEPQIKDDCGPCAGRSSVGKGQGNKKRLRATQNGTLNTHYRLVMISPPPLNSGLCSRSPIDFAHFVSEQLIGIKGCNTECLKKLPEDPEIDVAEQ